MYIILTKIVTPKLRAMAQAISEIKPSSLLFVPGIVSPKHIIRYTSKQMCISVYSTQICTRTGTTS